MSQASFSPLWDLEGEMIKKGQMSLIEGEKVAKKRCDEFCKNLRKNHQKYVRSMSYQTRKYWSFGDPCGMTAKCWLVSW